MSLAALLCCLAQSEDPLRDLWKPLDLDLRGMPAREAFDLLFARTGARLELPAFTDEKLTLEMKGASFWKAMDQLCRAHGSLRIPTRPFHGARHAVEKGTWIDFPVSYRGPLRFHLLDVGRVRELIYPRRLDRTDLTLMMSWPPDLTPVLDVLEVTGCPRLTRAEDDRGTSLLPVLDQDVEYDYNGRGRAVGHSSGWLLRLGPTSPGAKAIRTLEGEWEGAFWGGIDVLRFMNPAEEVGKSMNAGPVLVTLARFDRRVEADDSVSYEIRVKLGVVPSASEAWREGLKKIPLERRIQSRAYCGPLPRDGGLDGPSIVLLVPQKGVDSELRGWFRGTPGPLTIRVGRDPKSVTIPFAFENVRLPEEKR